jgi:hypothetical protein
MMEVTRVALRNWSLPAALILLSVPMTAQTPPASPAPVPTIEKKAAGLDALIAADAAFEKLGDGYAWTEGPFGTGRARTCSSPTFRTTSSGSGSRARRSRTT